MPLDFSSLKNEPRLLMEAELKLVFDSRKSKPVVSQ